MGAIIRPALIPSSDEKAALAGEGTNPPSASNPYATIADIPGAGPETYIAFDTTPTVPAHAEGQLYWDETDKTLAIDMAHTDVTLQVGQEQFVRVFNNTGGAIANGKVVYISGASGNRPTVALADADTEATQYVLGVVTHTLDASGDGRYGYCTVHGIVRGIDTSSWTAGLPLWLSSTAGDITQERPDAPKHAVYIGVPLNSTNNGSIFINPKAGNEIGELHDVLISGIADKDILQYDNSATVWKNVPRNFDALHGIESHGALSFSDADHTVTIATSCTYWYNGAKVVNSGATVCDLDLVADRDHGSATLTSNTLYFIYFKDATGKLYWSPTAWSINTSTVPVATVFWNGTNGALVEETHGYMRDLDWHKWAHLTIGARINPNDFALTAPSSGSPSTISIAGGTLYDEDHLQTHGTMTNCRIWQQVGASQYTFVNSTSIYPTSAGFVDSGDSYTRKAITSGFANYWVYVSPDVDRGLYVIEETRNVNGTTGYASLTQARAATPPNLANMGINPELKLIYRITFTSAEAFSESSDYRASAVLPSGGTTAPTAAAVTTIAGTSPYDKTNVQSYLEALVDNKASNSFTDRIVAVFDGGGSAIAANKKVYVYVPWACTIKDWTILADQSGSITIDVWKDTYANYPPTVADTITNSNKITLSSATKNQDVDVTNWGANPQTITAGDVLCFNVDALATSITWATVVLTVTRTI